MNIEENKIKHPFKTPEGYFDNLEDQILAEINLAKISKKEVFKTPDDFFSKLESEILSKTVEKPTLTVAHRNYSWKYIKVAAASLIFAGMGYLFYANTQEPKNDLAEISSDDIVLYLSTQPISMTDIAQNLDDKTVENLDLNMIPNSIEITENDLILLTDENEI